MSLLHNIIKLVSEEEEIPEELNGELGVSVSDFTVLTKRTVELVLNSVPAFSCLIKWVYDREAVEGVVPEVPLAHPLICLTGESHVIRKLAELLEHQVLVGCLLETHGFKDCFFCKSVGKPHEKISCMPVLSKDLKKFSNHEAESDQALACILALDVEVVDRIGSAHDVTHVVLGVEFFMRNARIEFEFLAVSHMKNRLARLELTKWNIGIYQRCLVVLYHKSKVDKGTKFKFCFVHLEVCRHSFVLASFRRFERSEKLVQTFSSLRNVSLNCLYPLD